LLNDHGRHAPRAVVKLSKLGHETWYFGTESRCTASNEAKFLQAIDFKKITVLRKCWRPLLDMRENYSYDIPPVRTPRRDKGTKRPKGLKHLVPLA
jgi:hypothetical protein